MQDSTKIQDSTNDLDGYSDFKDYLSKNLSHFEFENLHTTLGYESRVRVARLLNEKSPWSFNELSETIKMLENPKAPTILLKHFEVPHSLTQNEMLVIDTFAMEG
ncbi:hypothetical protein [Lentimicrobium sp. S6]|uniref:hypothetical protein n=1 Tax=Lentimicrobium sp. S6 TaxID=2735872 RepID=UPI0015521FCA|nr:hypothetical protein [Lentimicrobium sp. S6]NPD48070.1 hypothetical protein [Lentimicrobium sp. S6]